MKLLVKLCLILFLSLPVFPGPLWGSRPVDYLMTGCVSNGMLFSLRKGVVRSGVPPEMRANYCRVIPASLNLALYEGKKIRVRGFLSPGDRFQPDMKTVEILGICDKEVRTAIQQELPQVYRSRAEEKARENDWRSAWEFINKAITLDNSNCSLYLVRAGFYRQQGKLAEAAQDGQRAVQLGCKRYPDWLFLAELLEQVGKKSAALTAYEQGLAVCGYQPDKELLEQKINRLKAGGVQPPPQENRLQRLPPPPSLPD